MQIKWLRSTKTAKLPVKNNPTDSGYDVSSDEDLVIRSGNIQLVHTGIKVQLPRGYELQVRPRSGLAMKHGITVLNTPGTVDEGYRNEIGVILINHSNKTFHIEQGDRIAQFVIAKTVETESVEIFEFDEESDRGENGFGSSGVK